MVCVLGRGGVDTQKALIVRFPLRLGLLHQGFGNTQVALTLLATIAEVCNRKEKRQLCEPLHGSSI